MTRELSTDLVQKIKAIFSGVTDVLAVYIFGSRVQGYASVASDVDMAVVVNKKQKGMENRFYTMISDISFPGDLDFHVVDHSTNPTFLFQMISKGRRVYEKTKKKAILFEVEALKRYYDTAHMRAIYDYYIKQRFANSSYAR